MTFYVCLLSFMVGVFFGMLTIIGIALLASRAGKPKKKTTKK